MRLEIVTPEGEYFNDEVESVELPGRDGKIGALNDHAPLVTMIREEWDDDLFYTINKETTELALGPGFVEICPKFVVRSRLPLIPGTLNCIMSSQPMFSICV